MPFLKVDTAIVVEIGPLVDETDYKTLETAIAYNESGMSVDLIKNSASAITKVDITPTTGGANDWTHKGNGVYELEITAAQNDTEGSLRIVGVCDGVLPFESPVYTVVPANIYDSLIAGTDYVKTDMTQIAGAAVSTSSAQLGVNLVNIAGAAVNTSSAQIGTNVVNIEGSDATDQIRDSVFDDATRLDGSAVNALAAKASSADYLTGTASADGSGYSTHSAADVWTSGTRTLTSFGTLVADIWNALTSGLTTVGSVGKLIVDYLDAAVSSRAVAGDAMNLANDAITASKYDESTAFPVASADTGSTAIARVGADGDTLETISDQLDGVAVPGSAMNLADDAITASKYDESTAFPLTSADSGSTAVARTGADGDTLETISDQVDGVAVPGSAMTLQDDAITAAKYDESTAFPVVSADTGSTAIARVGADGDTLETLSDQLDGVAVPGSAMTLQDDAITAAKYDESTAFPLTSSDTGSTSVARTGADSDTLETLSDQIDGTAVPGSNMNLADDAITAAKYDESTAFPVKSDDSGSTAIARTGADGDTLETLSDQVDSVALEATLTAIKGTGWDSATDTLEKIRDEFEVTKHQTQEL